MDRRTVIQGSRPPSHLSSRDVLCEHDNGLQRRSKKPVMSHHYLPAGPDTCHWGFFEARLKPVLTIDSGDEVTVDTISGGPDVVPDKARFHVPSELAEVHAK